MMTSSSTNSNNENETTEENYNLWFNIKKWFNVPKPTTKVKFPVNPEETGWDRVKSIWITFNRGQDSVEVNIITNALALGGLCGFSLGSIISNREVFQNMIRQFNTNVYYGKRHANQMLSEKMYLEMFKKGTLHGMRYSLFSGTFVGMLTLCATYRNDIYYSDVALGGALVGGIWKSYLGPRAILVNAIGCSFFSLTFAALMRLSMHLMGTSIAEMRYFYKTSNPEV